ncbi:uncharacterized protein LOC104897833 [Beta vulgaris subsp. vulgaris]|uniref:uncharacterized protein LOC104897833 n=1 Tax=Beta vulgaris subsp. vulgaris TaxID=3555 RepID=UPI0025489219|nr:uncharacterized protein LOC104897833 [Beta vulgaris subsp. vulgaris]
MSGNSLNFEEPIKDAITRVRFSPESNNLLIASWDSSMRLVDVDSNKLRLVAQSEAAVLDCCFQNESVAFSAASDGSIFRYDLQSGASEIMGKHEDSATCIEYSPETSKVVTAGWDGKVLCWDSRSTKVSRALVGFNSQVDSISLCGIELLVAIGSSVRKYDMRKLNEAIQAEDLSMDVWIRCVRSMVCKKGFAVGSVDGHVTLQSNSDDMGYTFRCGPKSKKVKHHLVTVNDIAFNQFLPGVFVTGDYEGHVIAWDGSSRKRLLELPRYPNSIASLSYNHTGELLAVASSYTYQEANELEDHPQIFIQELGESILKSAAPGSSCRRYCNDEAVTYTVGLVTVFVLKYRNIGFLNFLSLLDSKLVEEEEAVTMSDEEHQFESKADSGASKTFPQQAGTIRKNGYIVIKNRPCKVVEVSTSKTGKHGHAKCNFVGIDIFTGKKLEDIVPSSHNCDVPHVNRTDYQLIDIAEDDFVSLLTETGDTKDDLKLPSDEALLKQVTLLLATMPVTLKEGFADGKDLIVSVQSAMGEEQICGVKDIGGGSKRKVAMSDEEHQFESKADAGASKTFPQQAGTIRKNGYIVIKNRPCKVVEVSTSKTGKHGHAKCNFVGIDIFTGKKLEDIVPSSHNSDVPHVNRTDYQLIDISEDGFVSLLTDSGDTKDDLKLPTDEALLKQLKDGFAEGKDLIVSVMNAMGEEQICGLKDIGPK